MRHDPHHLRIGVQRSELTHLLGTIVEAESDPGRREFLEGFPAGFGLLDGV
ncbi:MULTISPECIES: hypothetical protein [unclassified Streptomyces]|uniref:hypothetical protein n=1 Tax=unclassified Streptomyces TaxID=2593676 RepID=UPI002E77C1B4|nr:hypothetical protein [Streptomyces sp. JV184]MEE1744154.1 hypothetical protein [Streptomyces sp. JV184]